MNRRKPVMIDGGDRKQTRLSKDILRGYKRVIALGNAGD